MGLWENLGGGPLFSCFIEFLCYNFSKSFEGVREVPPSSPRPLVCIYDLHEDAMCIVKRYTEMLHLNFVFLKFSLLSLPNVFGSQLIDRSHFLWLMITNWKCYFSKKISTIQIDNFFLLLQSKFKQNYFKYSRVEFRSSLQFHTKTIIRESLRNFMIMSFSNMGLSAVSLLKIQTSSSPLQNYFSHSKYNVRYNRE
jgi:hypothetical protein